MRCNQAESLIGAWQDGELDAWTGWRVGRHVRHCPTCAAEAESLTGLTNTLRNAAPLGVAETVAPPRRNLSAPLSLALASVAAAAYLLVARSPIPPKPVLERGTIAHAEKPAHSVRASVPRKVTVPAVAVLPKTPFKASRVPAARHIAARKKPAFHLHPVRVDRKPSLLPPLTRPDWTGSSIRYVATLTPEERQVQIISIESELPPDEELRRLVEEKSEFIFVQASLPPELREGAQGPILLIP